jgi:uncharacterized protein (DUF433 family)
MIVSSIAQWLYLQQIYSEISPSGCGHRPAHSLRRAPRLRFHGILSLRPFSGYSCKPGPAIKRQRSAYTQRGHGRNLIRMKQPVVCRNAEVMGTAVFYGTRVPVQTLLDYLEAGETIDDFLKGFLSVTREHVIAFLEEAKDRLIETVS